MRASVVLLVLKMAFYWDLVRILIIPASVPGMD